MAFRVDPFSIAFDIDGVVADTMRLFLEITRDDFGYHGLAYEDITCYHLDECVDIPGEILRGALEKLIEGTYRQPLRPIAGAREVLTRLGERNGGLLFVTARPHPGPMADWMRRLLPELADAIEIVPTGDFNAKVGVLKERGITSFVEDRLETCFVLDAAGITPVLFRQPWNRRAHPFTEVAGWQELEALMRADETVFP